MRFYYFIIIFSLTTAFTSAQVKIGANPDVINSSSILELESTDKALVITRLTTLQMNALTPLQGALIFNTDASCFFYFDGSSWLNLCTVALDFQELSFDPTTNILQLSNGSSVDLTTIREDILADNGLTRNSNTIELGGNLNKPTTITTSNTNTLAIDGLQDSTTNTDEIITVNPSNGVLKKRTISSIIQQEQQVIVTAANGQSQFNTPITITDASKIDVYRNGVRIDFTVVNTTTLEIEPEAICFEGDEIRIVQLN